MGVGGGHSAARHAPDLTTCLSTWWASVPHPAPLTAASCLTIVDGHCRCRDRQCAWWDSASGGFPPPSPPPVSLLKRRPPDVPEWLAAQRVEYARRGRRAAADAKDAGRLLPSSSAPVTHARRPLVHAPARHPHPRSPPAGGTACRDPHHADGAAIRTTQAPSASAPSHPDRRHDRSIDAHPAAAAATVTAIPTAVAAAPLRGEQPSGDAACGIAWIGIGKTYST